MGESVERRDNQRRIIIPNKRFKQKKVERKKEDVSTGGRLKEWLKIPSQETPEKPPPLNGTRILELKKKLHLVKPVLESDEEIRRKRKFDDTKSIFEERKKTSRYIAKKIKITPVKPADEEMESNEQVFSGNRQTDIRLSFMRISKSSKSLGKKGSGESGEVEKVFKKAGMEKERGNEILGGKIKMGIVNDGGGGRDEINPTWLQPKLKIKVTKQEKSRSTNNYVMKDLESPMGILPDNSGDSKVKQIIRKLNRKWDQ